MAIRIKSALKKFVLHAFERLREVSGPLVNPTREIHVYVGKNGDIAEFERRLEYFIPELKGHYQVHERYSMRLFLSHAPVIMLDATWGDKICTALGHYSLDYKNSPLDAWNWFRLSSFLDKKNVDKNVASAAHKFRELALGLKKEKSRVYIFGTGPSLEMAGELDWSDGIRVVSNTIVKDADLWRHINPHFIVAGDALYHFGHTPFPRAFRSDLRIRLSESNAYFIYPSIFDPLVRREFPEHSDRLIPIPYGDFDNPIVDLLGGFELPLVGNVLNQLLLPVASTLAKDIFLWGFDGRAPGDKMFWKNSGRHFYQEHVPQLQAAHPAFFNRHVPQDKPEAYVKAVHGDKLDEDLSRAEANGYRFVLLHKSWTETLQKRYASPSSVSINAATQH